MMDTIMMDYSDEPRRDILCIDAKSLFASVEAVERKQNPLEARIAVVSKPDNNGGLVLASSPLVKKRIWREDWNKDLRNT